jgi:hypothetical protein
MLLEEHHVQTNRRTFIKAAGADGARDFSAGTVSAQIAAATGDGEPFDGPVPYTTELFLENQLLEATPGVSRRLHP